MDQVPESVKLLKIIEVKGLAEKTETKIAVRVFPSGNLMPSPIGQLIQIQGTSFQLIFQHSSEEFSSSVLSIPKEITDWVAITDTISLKISVLDPLSVNTQKKKPKLLALGQPKIFKCEYLRKLEEIHEKEKEIILLMRESQEKAPENYKEYLGSSPNNSAKKSPLKKKTLDPESFSRFEGDYCFESYFNVDIPNVSQSEGNLLETAAVGLISKVKALKLDVDEYQKKKEILMDFDSPMKILEESVKESKEQIEAENSKIDEIIRKVQQEIVEIEKEVQSVDNKNHEFQENIRKMNQAILEISSENSEKKVSEVRLEIEETSRLRAELSNIIDETERLEKYYAKISAEFQQNYPEQELAQVVNDKVMKNAELQRITNKRDEALQENLNLQSEILLTESNLSLQNDLVLQDSAYKTSQGLFAESSKSTMLALLNLQESRDSNLKSSSSFMQILSESLDPIAESINSATKVLSERTQLHLKQTEEYDELQKNNESLSHVLEREKQILSEYSEVKKQFDNSNDVQKSVLFELETLSDQVLKLSESSLTINRLLKRADDMIEEQELQQISMYKLISLIKETKPAHIAVQNDPVDMALAKYLNARHKTLEVNFRRTEKEKYLFGSLKVEVLVEGNEIFVKPEGKNVAGIEEFIEFFTPIEKERMIKRQNSKLSDKKEERKVKIGGKAPLIPLAQILKKVK